MKGQKIPRLSLLYLASATLIIAVSTIALTFKRVPGNSCCAAPLLTEEAITNETVGTWEGQKVTVPPLALEKASKYTQVLGSSVEDKWIEVDLSDQKLRAWEGGNLYLETLVSTGLPWTPTPQGEFRIWSKMRATKMEGGEGKYYYYLPNVPYVMFFENDKIPGYRGYSLHGTYWHNDFGKVHSHGCVNLPTPMAEKIYFWAAPVLPEGKKIARASVDNPGTRIVIHE
jgi:hypothetical protein